MKCKLHLRARINDYGLAQLSAHSLSNIGHKVHNQNKNTLQHGT